MYPSIDGYLHIHKISMLCYTHKWDLCVLHCVYENIFGNYINVVDKVDSRNKLVTQEAYYTPGVVNPGKTSRSSMLG